MTERVLIVDDDPNVLKAYERRLRKRFDVETALCSEEGVTAVNILGPFAVVVSDMQMPRENGAAFLQKVLRAAPDSVRIMLTGSADQATAAAAINQGRVYRFLNKPCESEELAEAIQAGIEEHQRRRSEVQMLSQTVLGVVKMMSKVLSITNREAFGRAARLKELVAAIAKHLGTNDAWEYETAALLSQLGWITIPDAIVTKHTDAKQLNPDEQRVLDSRFNSAADLIDEVPRLERTAEMVRRSQAPTPPRAEDDPIDPIDLGAELLRMATRYDSLVYDVGAAPPLALETLASDRGGYNANCLAALQQVIAKVEERVLVTTTIAALKDGMVLAEHIESTDGALLVSKGQEVTPTLRQRLANYRQTHSIREPIKALTSLTLQAATG